MTKSEVTALFLITVLLFFAGFCAGQASTLREERSQSEFECLR